MRRRLCSVALAALALPAIGQEPGWQYSPYPGEGDRAALGCAYDSRPEIHACLAVRCEDDFSVAVHLETTRLGGDAGRWKIQIDDQTYEVAAAVVPGSPYGAKVEGDVAPLVEAIRHGASLFLEPLDGAPLPLNGIGLAGSLYAINRALYFCAPRGVPDGPAADGSAR